MTHTQGPWVDGRGSAEGRARGEPRTEQPAAGMPEGGSARSRGVGPSVFLLSLQHLEYFPSENFFFFFLNFFDTVFMHQTQTISF